MKKNRVVLTLLLIAVILAISSCSYEKMNKSKIKDLDYTVVSEIEMPKEVLDIVNNRKTQPFKVTYSDKEYTYIIIGYGQQKYSGYSIKVEEVYESKNSICVKTKFEGPTKYSNVETLTCPYIVIKIEYNDKTVVFGA